VCKWKVSTAASMKFTVCCDMTMYSLINCISLRVNID